MRSQSFVGWVEALRNPTLSGICWVSLRQPNLPEIGYYQNRIEVYIFIQEILVEQFIDESFLGLPLNENMDSNHREGLPPRRFFFHNSPRL